MLLLGLQLLCTYWFSNATVPVEYVIVPGNRLPGMLDNLVCVLSEI